MTDSAHDTSGTPDTPADETSSSLYNCGGLPDAPVDDLELIQFFRGRIGNEIVNEQVAVLGADRVLHEMQRAHQAHLAAAKLTPRELHQRAELLESLLIEFGVPEVGAAGGVHGDEPLASDGERVQLFVDVVKKLADKVAEVTMQEELLRADLEPEYEVE